MICIHNQFFENIDDFFSVLGNFDLSEPHEEDNWQGSRSEELSSSNKKAYDIAINAMLDKFQILKSKNFRAEAFIHWRSDKHVNPHTDYSDYNCLVYLSGVSSQFNGTGFYTGVEGSKDEFLNLTVGFQPNRAIFFEGSNVHACINALGQGDLSSQGRYTLNIFVYLEEDNE